MKRFPKWRWGFVTAIWCIAWIDCFLIGIFFLMGIWQVDIVALQEYFSGWAWNLAFATSGALIRSGSEFVVLSISFRFVTIHRIILLDSLTNDNSLPGWFFSICRCCEPNVLLLLFHFFCFCSLLISYDRWLLISFRLPSTLFMLFNRCRSFRSLSSFSIFIPFFNILLFITFIFLYYFRGVTM